MENLFNYATKELSQDAFLRWLFESWQDKDLTPVVSALLKKFCMLSDDEKITEIKTVAQWRKIDITVYVDTDKRKLALFIEDKSFSSEHDQLLKYNADIETIKDRDIFKIFYKTSLLNDKDIASARNANWKTYDVNEIYELFRPFADTENVILLQYINYINAISMATKSIDKPWKNDNNIHFIQWYNYFKEKILPNFINEFPKSVVLSGTQWRWPYSCLQIKAKENAPYLEIQSKDCVDDKIIVRLLCYGVKDFSPIEKAIQIATKSAIFDCSHIVNRNNKPKQIGKFTREHIKTDDDFSNAIKDCLSTYQTILELWDNGIYSVF